MNIHHYWRFREGSVEYYRGSEDTAQTKYVLGAWPGLVSSHWP